MPAYDPAAWVPFFTAIIAAAAGAHRPVVRRGLDQPRPDTQGRQIPPGPGRRDSGLAAARGGQLGSRAGTAEHRLLGLEILIVVVPMLVITVRSQLTHRRQNRDDPLLWTVSRMAGTAAATVPCTVAGVSLALHGGGGFYWLAPAALLGTVGAVYNAWVLRVEIVR
jgi:hypothetical protein